MVEIVHYQVFSAHPLRSHREGGWRVGCETKICFHLPMENVWSLFSYVRILQIRDVRGDRFDETGNNSLHTV